MGWQPILEGGLKDRARESVAAVLEALSTRERDLDDAPSLAGGTAGLAILHGYLAQTEGGQVGPSPSAASGRHGCRGGPSRAASSTVD
jgi:hypothetical protein